MKAARPKSVLLFDWFYLSARILSALPATYHHIVSYREGKTDPELGTTGLVIYYALIFSPMLPPLLLWFFVSRRANNVAKGLLFAFVAYEALAVAVNWLSPAPNMVGYQLALITMVTFDVAAVAMLNRPDSRTWFKLRGRFDPDTFN